VNAEPDLNDLKYQRYMNVYAAPPRQVEKFIAPVFPKSEAGVKFLLKAVSNMVIARYCHTLLKSSLSRNALYHIHPLCKNISQN
jgi:hypothetical protein